MMDMILNGSLKIVLDEFFILMGFLFGVFF